jgi:hypothetical protein
LLVIAEEFTKLRRNLLCCSGVLTFESRKDMFEDERTAKPSIVAAGARVVGLEVFRIDPNGE